MLERSHKVFKFENNITIVSTMIPPSAVVPISSIMVISMVDMMTTRKSLREGKHNFYVVLLPVRSAVKKKIFIVFYSFLIYWEEKNAGFWAADGFLG